MERIDHILVVDDDRDIRELIVGYLEKSGYRASGAANGKAMWSVLKNHQIDLIVLDIMLPGDDGLTLCRQLRNDGQQDIPVLMLTSKTGETDEILAMSYGADDYMTKPYNPALLLLKIEAIFRRIQPKSSEEETEYQGVRLNLLRSTVEYGEKEVVLSKNEMSILHYLMKHRGKIVSRDELMDYLWDCNDFVDDNTLTVNINRLRRRMEEAGISGMIETRRRQGYILV